jgi:hypothetical protein
VQSLVRVMRALVLLLGVWAILALVGWATGALPPAPPDDPAAAAGDPEPPADAGVDAPDAPPDAGPSPGEDAGPPEPPPLPVRQVPRFTACGPEGPPPSLSVLRVLGDPRPELAIGCGPLVQLMMVQRGDGGSLAPVRVVALEAANGEPGTRVRSTTAAAADVDGDSAPDLVLGFVHEGPEGDPRGGALFLVRTNPTGAFEAPERLAPIAAVALATADLDDTPGADVVALHQASRFARRPSELWVFGGGPAPARRAQLRTGVGAEDLAVADLDDDGHLDLVAVAGESQRVDVFFGDGSGRFPRSTTLELAGGRGATTGDLSGDGAAQVLLLAETLSVLDYEASETLQARPLATPGGFHQPRIVDVNGDGRSDIVGIVADRGAVWLEHTGEPMAFKEADLVTFAGDGFQVHAVKVADMDANGRLDAIILGRAAEGAPWELLLLPDLERGARLELAAEARSIDDAPLTLQVSLR